MKHIHFNFMLTTLAALLAATSLRAEVYSGTCGYNLTWSLDTETGVMTIDGSGNMNSYSRTTVNGKNVTSAPWNAYINDIKSLVVGENVTSIGDYAFYCCSALTSIGDLKACQTIGSQAFYQCSALTQVGDLTACTYIGQEAFSGCSALTSIGDLTACKSIGDQAFYQCSALTSIGDLTACTSIGQSAFSGCSALTQIGDLTACTSIGSYAFQNCKIATLRINNSTPPTLGGGNFTSTTILVPAESVDTYRSATNWSNMAQLIIAMDAQTAWDIETEVSATSSGVQNKIGEENLQNVVSLKVTGDLNAYDFFVFRNKMPNLHFLDLTDTRIVKTEDGYKYYSNYTTQDSIFPEFAFYERTKLTSIKLPNAIKSIGARAFCGCSSLTQISLQEGIERLEENSFFGCSNLQTIFLPNTLNYIGTSAFTYCSKLTDLTLPDAISGIDEHAFLGCSSLKEITLPASLTSIGWGAFEDCSSLQTVKTSAIDPSTVPISDNTFSTYQTATLYVPIDEETGWDATYNAYYWNTQWGQFLNIDKWTPNYQNIYLNDDYEQPTGTIPGDSIDAQMDPGTGYQLGDEAEQEFDDVHLHHDGQGQGGCLIADGNLFIHRLWQEIQVQANRWHFFCFPFDVRRSDIESPGLFVFRRYDGNQRAQHGSGGWQNLPDDDEWLHAGQGYIFQTNRGGTLRLKVHNPDSHADNRSPQLQTHTAQNLQDASWNFVGNPYMSYYGLEDLDFDAPVTVWNGSSYEAVRPGDDDYLFHPYQAFFVQRPEGKADAGFKKQHRVTYKQGQRRLNQARARRAQERTDRSRLLVNLTIGQDGTEMDKTRVVLNEKRSMEYEMACDAAKFMSNESAIQLYTTDGKTRYAINERPAADGTVRLGITARKAGIYTLSAPRMDCPMMLHDTATGTDFDLSQGPAQFQTETGTFDNRFVLSVKEGTGIETTTDNRQQTTVIYDLSGRRINGQQSRGVVIENGKKVVK